VYPDHVDIVLVYVSIELLEANSLHLLLFGLRGVLHDERVAFARHDDQFQSVILVYLWRLSARSYTAT
jgi:hypothetical protein